jgi:hypothetical protein
MTGTASQIEWAEQIKPRVNAEFDRVAKVSCATNASAGIALCCRAFVTVMQATEVRNLDDRSETRDLPNIRTLLVES